MSDVAPGRNPAQKRSRRRFCFLGCLSVPVAGLLILSVYATVQSVQSGRIVPFPEISTSPEWVAEGLPGLSVGGWWRSESIVHASQGGLTATDTDNGQQLWQLETDPGVCDVAEEPVDGVGVVLLDGDHVDPDPLSFEEDNPQRSCDNVLAVDLDDGTELWRSGPLLEGGDPEERYQEELDVSVHEDGVVVRVDDELRGLDLSDGSQTWSHPELTADGTSCPTVDLAARDDTRATAVADCGFGEQISVHVVDAGDGAETSSFAFDRETHETGDELAPTALLNTNPTVIYLDLGHRRGPERDHDPDLTESGADDPHWEQWLVFDDEGALISSTENHLHMMRDHDAEEPQLLFTEDRLYKGTDSGCTNSVYSHDLADSTELWETSMRGDDHRPVAVQDNQLLTIRGGGPSGDKCTSLAPTRSWQLYTLDTETGEAQPLTQQMSSHGRPQPDQVWWRGEHVYFIEQEAPGPLSESPEDRSPSIIAF